MSDNIPPNMPFSILDAPLEQDENNDYATGGIKSKDGWISCGYASIRGRRPRMEDFYDVKMWKIDGQFVYLFGVFDGHGGPNAAKYLKEHLFENLSNHPQLLTDTKLAISEVYQQTDVDYLNFEDSHRDDGSTATTAILVGTHLYVANVGDSRTVISKGNRAIPLSIDHKPDREDELRRIRNAGGRVSRSDCWRVNGTLAMSRAFGDRSLKRFVVAEPEIQEEAISPEFGLLVLATDGLWDALSNEEVIALAKTEDDPEEAAKKLALEALSRGSTDNVTCLVVKFHHGMSTDR